MRTAPLFSLLLTVVALTASASDLSSLPAGRIKVDVMQTVTAPRAAELPSKESNARGLDLTRAEHAELQRLGGELKLVKAAEAEIEFVRTADGRIVLQPDSSLPELAGIVIDVENDVVETPFGRTTEGSNVIAREDARVGGSWNGTEWKLDTPGEMFGTGTSVKLALGHLIYDGRGVLAYEARSIEDGQIPRRASRVLLFSFR